jgi:hypothetical protein
MDGRPPDVEIAAAIRANEVRFECRPEVSVIVWADSPASTIHESEREGLPDEVEHGVTYRNIAVRWRVGARLNDQEWLPPADEHPDS